MNKFYSTLLLISFLIVSSTYAQNNECNVFELLAPIPQGSPSQDDPPSPCGFFMPVSNVYVNQCSPCGRKIMDDNCMNTPNPTLCELDGFETTTGGFSADLGFVTDPITGDLIPFAQGFCNGGGTIENNFWIGFTAQTNEVCIAVTVGACTTGNGIQVAIVETNCVDEFTTQSGNNPCTFSGISPGRTQQFDSNSLVPGNPYFIMIDGFAGDICDLRIDVNCGFAEPEFDVLPVQTAVLCPDVLVDGTFTAQPGTGAIIDVTVGGIATTDLTFFWLNPAGDVIAETSPTFVIGNVVRGELDGSFFTEMEDHQVQIIDNGTCCPICTTFPIEIAMPPPATAAIIAGVSSADELGCNNDTVLLLGEPEGGSITPQIEQWQIVNSAGEREIIVQSFVQVDGRVNELEVTRNLVAQFFPGQVFGTATFVYRFLEDVQKLCLSEASVEVSFDFSEPNINIATPDVLGGQANPTVELDASMTNTNGSGATYAWTFQDGTTNGIVSGANTAIATVNQPGVYTLVVTNNGSGCSSTQQVQVQSNGSTTPFASIATPDVLNCRNAGQGVVLDGSSSTGSGALTYQWSDSAGNVIGTTAFINVTQPGIYTLIVSDNNVDDTATVEVVSDFFGPQNVTASGGVITCDNMNGIQLMATSSSPIVSYLWMSGSGVQFSGQNPIVSEAGTYTLTVTNEENGCTITATTEVSTDIDVPTVLFEQISGDVGLITCLNPSREFLGFVDGAIPDPNIVLTWFDPNGNPLAGNPIVIDENSIEGTYIIEGVNPTNNCSGASAVNISFDFTLPDFTLAGGTIFCSPNETVALSATDNDPMSTSSFEWTAPNGTSFGLQSNPTVSTPGIYTLLATNTTSGCTAEGAVEVLANNEAPVVSTAGIFTLTCTPGQDNYDLDGSATSANPMDEFTFVWTLDGVTISTEPNPNVTESGTYILTVTNTVSNCVATASVLLGDVRAELVLTIDFTSSEELLVTVSGGAAPYTYLWNDGTTAEAIENPILGFAYEVTVTDANGCTEVIAEIFQPNAIQDTELKDIAVYPNPSTGMFHVSYDTELHVQDVSVYDIRGRKVYAQSYLDRGIFSDLDISDFVQGAYILEVQFAEGVFRDKILIFK